MAIINNSALLKELGSIIQYHRKQNRLTRLQLARLAKVGKTVIFDLEQGKESVRLNTLFKVLTVLDITVDLKSPLMFDYYLRKHDV